MSGTSRKKQNLDIEMNTDNTRVMCIIASCYYFKMSTFTGNILFLIRPINTKWREQSMFYFVYCVQHSAGRTI